MNRKFAIAAIAAVWGLGAAAFAQSGPPQPEGLNIAVGGGLLFAPTYVGDDDYQLSTLPNIQIRYGNRFFASVQDGLGYNVVNTPNWRAGPIARIA
ncbi:MAG: MipA/OmpV family protein, partial [Hyphococcus sp.]